jgi:3D (Asp-Asp-Asp) domain-containing protein
VLALTASAPALAASGGTAPASWAKLAGTSAGQVPAGLGVGATIGGHAITGVVHLTATAYGPSLADNYPYPAVDFFGKPLVPGDVAVDPGVIPLGTHLYVQGYRSPSLPAGGEYAWARDEGGAIQGNRIDMFIDGNPRQVSNFGVQRVTAYILN